MPMLVSDGRHCNSVSLTRRNARHGDCFQSYAMFICYSVRQRTLVAAFNRVLWRTKQVSGARNFTGTYSFQYPKGGTNQARHL